IGKTFLCKSIKGIHYFDCEIPSIRRQVEDENFLKYNDNKIIALDEIHRLKAPHQILKLAADYYKNLMDQGAREGNMWKYVAGNAGKAGEFFVAAYMGGELLGLGGAGAAGGRTIYGIEMTGGRFLLGTTALGIAERGYDINTLYTTGQSLPEGYTIMSGFVSGPLAYPMGSVAIDGGYAAAAQTGKVLLPLGAGVGIAGAGYSTYTSFAKPNEIVDYAQIGGNPGALNDKNPIMQQIGKNSNAWNLLVEYPFHQVAATGERVYAALFGAGMYDADARFASDAAKGHESVAEAAAQVAINDIRTRVTNAADSWEYTRNISRELGELAIAPAEAGKAIFGFALVPYSVQEKAFLYGLDNIRKNYTFTSESWPTWIKSRVDYVTGMGLGQLQSGLELAYGMVSYGSGVFSAAGHTLVSGDGRWETPFSLVFSREALPNLVASGVRNAFGEDAAKTFGNLVDRNNEGRAIAWSRGINGPEHYDNLGFLVGNWAVSANMFRDNFVANRLFGRSEGAAGREAVDFEGRNNPQAPAGIWSRTMETVQDVNGMAMAS
ncbi:MAG: hypothetical protein NTY99_03795, partial [DPANN group archaeon]|nr:hypothetical protein [DPANN group archaeon]